MKRLLASIAMSAGLAGLPALAQDACPWAGGDYDFNEHGIYGTFTVDSGCTQIVWSRLSDGPETATLKRTKGGWTGDLTKVRVELLENGHSLRITDYGGATRQTTAIPR